MTISEFDIGFRIDNQSVYIYERRQNWRDKTQYIDTENAKLTWVKTQKQWKIFLDEARLKMARLRPYPSS